jgi:hypothetical protein
VGILPNVGYLSTMRNSGYNNYTAIADIVDNSLETDVNSKNVWVNINFKLADKELKPESNITIIDDGCGMDFNILHEALKLGSIGSKDSSIDLGCYGTGLKTAFLSIGRKLVIKTKELNSPFLIAVFDYDYMIDNNIWSATIGEGSDEEYEKFKTKTSSETGTIVEISNIDRASNTTNVTNFKDTLIKKFGLNYKYIIEENKVNIFVNGCLVKPFDPMYRNENWSKLMSEFNETFEYKNKTYRFNAYYLESQSGKFSESIGRNAANNGIYIYRNYRLVGEGLCLGTFTKGDGYLNGFRFELFIDGNDDYIFGSSFLKVITEKDKTTIDQGFMDKLSSYVSIYAKSALTLKRLEKDVNIDDKNVNETMDGSFKEINDTKLLKLAGKNNKVGGEKSKPEKHNENTGPRNRKEVHPSQNGSREFVRWETREMGEGDPVCSFGRESGKHVIYWNSSHVFWKEFLAKYAKSGNGDVVGVVNKLFVGMALARDNFDDNNMVAMIDEYHLSMSDSLRKLMNKFI